MYIRSADPCRLSNLVVAVDVAGRRDEARKVLQIDDYMDISDNGKKATRRRRHRLAQFVLQCSANCKARDQVQCHGHCNV